MSMRERKREISNNFHIILLQKQAIRHFTTPPIHSAALNWISQGNVLFSKSLSVNNSQTPCMNIHAIFVREFFSHFIHPCCWLCSLSLLVHIIETKMCSKDFFNMLARIMRGKKFIKYLLLAQFELKKRSF